MGLVPLKRDPRKFPQPVCHTKVQLESTMNQKAGSHQTPKLLAPWSWTSSLQTEINFCCLYSASSAAFCYSSPKRLRHPGCCTLLQQPQDTNTPMPWVLWTQPSRSYTTEEWLSTMATHYNHLGFFFSFKVIFRVGPKNHSFKGSMGEYSWEVEWSTMNVE